MNQCNIPPQGWLCTRDAGHEGPCAAVPSAALPSESTALPSESTDALLHEALSMMKEFCRRVEAGEVRSSKTYNQFKIFIAKAEFTACLPSNTN